MGQQVQVRDSGRGWVNWGARSALSSHRIWRFCRLMMGPSSSPWSAWKRIGESHRFAMYVCCLWETFRRDTAEMAPCWLYVSGSFILIIVHVKAIDQWPSISCYRLIALMRIAPKKSCPLVSQMSIQTTGCLAIFLVMQQKLRLDLDCLLSHFWLKCALARAGACIKHQRGIHFPPCYVVFTVITGGFDPPTDKEINKFIT